MTLAAHYEDDDEPMVHKPMTGFTAALFGLGVAHMRSAEATAAIARAEAQARREQRGTPDAIADARKRLREAQERANLIVLYGACPACCTPYTNEEAVCKACPPRLVSAGPHYSEDWAQHEDNKEP